MYMFILCVTTLFNYTITYILLSILFIVYGIVNSVLGKNYVIPLAISYFFTFNQIGSKLWKIQKWQNFGAIYLFLAIIIVPLTLLITIEKGKSRVWGECLTISTGVWIVLKEEIYFLAIIPVFFFWLLLIDLADALIHSGLSRIVYNRISEILVVFCICLGYYLNQSGQQLGLNDPMTFWIYFAGLSHLLLLLL